MGDALTKQILQFKPQARLLYIDCQHNIHSVWYGNRKEKVHIGRIKLNKIIPKHLVEALRLDTLNFMKQMETGINA